MNRNTIVLVGLFAACWLSCAAGQPKNKKPVRNPTLQEAPLFDAITTSVSDVELNISNYGNMNFVHSGPVPSAQGPAWPRGSDNLSVFGGGFWFAALKDVDGKSTKLTTITFNPQTNSSWFVPGRIEDGNALLDDDPHRRKYRAFRSSDFKSDGTAVDPAEYPMWPIWDAQPNRTLQENGYLGMYIADTIVRSVAVYPKGPVVLSDEDIHAVYKDTDLTRYETPEDDARQRGYPLALEVEQFVYSYRSELLRNVLIFRYEIANRSTDTLRDCWFAPIYDFDLSPRSNIVGGAGNDRARYFSEDPTLNLAYQWTEGDQGESGMGFGYAGVAFLETPAVDETGFLRKEKSVFELEEQQGLHTFQNWRLLQGPQTDEDRYNFLSEGGTSGNDESGDWRFAISTGPCTMLPGDTLRVAYALAFALPVGGPDATGTSEDAAELARVVRAARDAYYNKIVTAIRPSHSAAAAHSVSLPYPNPARQEVRLDLTLEQPTDVRIEAISSIGSTVFKDDIRVHTGAHSVVLRLAELASGAYYLRIAIGGRTEVFPLTLLR